MRELEPSSHDPGGAAYRRATRLAFFIAGFAMSTWAPLVPFAKQRANVDEAQLGMLLLCLGVGSIVAMPFAGRLTTRYGCRAVMGAGTLAVCAALPGLAVLENLHALMATLFLFGAGLGSIDCTVNIQAILVERADARPLMSGFHGFFSLAGIVATVLVFALLSQGLSPLATTLAIVAVTLLALAVSWSHLLPYGGQAGGPAFALPHGKVLWLGLIACVVFLTEGAVLDWSAVFLASERGVRPEQAGVAYTCFAVAMTIGRLTGDTVVSRLGPRQVLLLGGLCASLGLGVATLVPSLGATLVGFTLVGVGCSNIVPVAFSAAGNQQSMPESQAIPAITTLGYAGILVGPAAIGFVAKATSLHTALLGLSGLLLGVAAASRMFAPRQAS